MKKGIEMKGDEKELREYFYERKRIEDKKKFKLPFNIGTWTESQKVWLIIGIVFFLMIALDSMIVSSAWESYNHKNYYTFGECQAKLNQYITTAQLPWYQAIITAFMPYAAGFALAIILGWIIHGVGFKFIGVGR